MFSVIADIFTDYTLRTVALGSAVLGLVSGILGSFAVLRKQSLLGDAISHAALPGVALAFIFFRSKAPLLLILGAAIAGWLGTLLIMAIVKSTRIKYDSALGIILSIFFGFGIVLLTFIQKMPDANQAGLDKFLFGQASTLLMSDVTVMLILSAVVIFTVILLWKEFKILSFDPEFFVSLGFPSRALDILLTSLLVIAIVLGLQMVGVVLMSAMIIAPASAARFWTDKLIKMALLSGLFGAVAGISGAVISSTTSKLPTGPTIVICISGIFLISLLIAPKHGLVWNWIARQQNSRKLRLGIVLSNLYQLALQHKSREHPHASMVLRTMSRGKIGVQKTLQELEQSGLVQTVGRDQWSLTAEGFEKARALNERNANESAT